MNGALLQFTQRRFMTNMWAAQRSLQLDQGLIDKLTNNQNSLNLMSIDVDETEIEMKGRNSKQPKKANHGARPCSSVMRRLKKQGTYKKVTKL